MSMMLAELRLCSVLVSKNKNVLDRTPSSHCYGRVRSIFFSLQRFHGSIAARNFATLDSFEYFNFSVGNVLGIFLRHLTAKFTVGLLKSKD